MPFAPPSGGAFFISVKNHRFHYASISSKNQKQTKRNKQVIQKKKALTKIAMRKIIKTITKTQSN